MSSASSGGKSLAVLIKKAMAKIPASLDTKKSIDEYYKTTMKEIVMKMKAEEKAMKAKADAMKAKGKTVKKQKKVGGGMTKEELKKELEIIDEIMELFIVYNKKVSVYRVSVGDAKNTNGREYFLSDEYTTHINTLVDLLKLISGIKEKIDRDKILMDSERKENIIISKESLIYRDKIYDALIVYIKYIYIIIATRHNDSYDKYKKGDKYASLYSELYPLQNT
jgi:hypothetical protein